MSIFLLPGVLWAGFGVLVLVFVVVSEGVVVGGGSRLGRSVLGGLRGEVDASLRKVTQLVDEINRKWPFARNTELKLP
ncbi:hypothetical protein [Collimonas sp. OK607]|uniref:hypothetical protein n=1 Tax=Collimonas sp. OK607 TaxID=1798194 RepID=UPI001113B3C9|nr:hypothetical protein [Collimonas sp. OK607]